MEIKFNDKRGNRDRVCNYGIVRSGKFYLPDQAEDEKFAQFISGKYVKQGKWSNTDWTVRLGSESVLVVVMSPFDGWGATLQEMIEQGIESCHRYTGIRVTPEEMGVALKSLYPRTWAEREPADLI